MILKGAKKKSLEVKNIKKSVEKKQLSFNRSIL